MSHINTTLYIIVSSAIFVYFMIYGIKQLKMHVHMKKMKKGIFIANNIECCICLESVSRIGHLNCGHVFCISCILKWREINSTCPICRADAHLIELL